MHECSDFACCPGHRLLTEMSQTSIQTTTWICNYIHTCMWGAITHPCPNSKTAIEIRAWLHTDDVRCSCWCVLMDVSIIKQPDDHSCWLRCSLLNFEIDWPSNDDITDSSQSYMSTGITWPSPRPRPGGGVTKTISSVPLFADIFTIVNIHFSYWLSRLYLAGVTAAQLRRHLPNINVNEIVRQTPLQDRKFCLRQNMMTSSNGNIFRVTGHLCGEFPTQRPVTRNFDVYFDLSPNKRLSKHSWCWWSETPSGSLWRHRND